MSDVLRISSPDELEDWLKSRPARWTGDLASRVALRVMPIAFSILEEPVHGVAEVVRLSLILQTFRACFISWVNQRYFSHHVNVALALAAARDAENIADIVLKTHANSARAAAVCAEAASQAVEASATISNQSLAAFAAATAANAAHAIADAAEDVWGAVSEDCAWLESNGERLIDQPLWLIDVRGEKNYRANFPIWARNSFDRFARSQMATNSSWKLVVEWYRAILLNGKNLPPFSRFGEHIDIEIALKPHEFWDDHPNEVVAMIAETIAAKPSGATDADDNAATEQRPAPFQFRWESNKISAIQPISDAFDGSLAQELLSEVREKASELNARLERANADRRVQSSVAKLYAALPESIEDLQVGVLRSRSRSIEADASSFAASENELFPDAISSMVDLSETLRDLLGCFPAIRELEAEVLAMDLTGADLEFVKSELDKIANAVEGVDGLADESAVNALETMEGLASEGATRIVKEKRTAEYALVVRNVASVVVRESRRFAVDAAGSVRKGSLTGLEKGTEAAVKTMFAAAIGSMAGPLAAVGVFVASFIPLGKSAKITKDDEKSGAEGS